MVRLIRSEMFDLYTMLQKVLNAQVVYDINSHQIHLLQAHSTATI